MSETEKIIADVDLDLISSDFMEAVRRRPAMYIGGIDARGLHQLLLDVLEIPTRAAAAGACKRVEVGLFPDGVLVLRYDGPGLTADVHPETGLPLVELAATMSGSACRRAWDPYCVTCGPYDLCLTHLNALSELMEIEVCHNGGQYRICFSRGRKTQDLHRIGDCGLVSTGTQIQWRPDREIFGDVRNDQNLAAARCRELAGLIPGLKVWWTGWDENGQPRTEAFCFARGLADYLAATRIPGRLLHAPILLEGRRGDVSVSAAVAYSEEQSTHIASWANFDETEWGGTHVTGFKTALTRVLNQYARTHGLLTAGDANLTGDQVRRGLSAAIAVDLPSLEFWGATRRRMIHPDAVGAVNSVVGSSLAVYLEANPDAARIILEHVRSGPPALR